MSLRKPFKFFLEHAGYCTPPGRAVCAMELARAEQHLANLVDAGQARVVWEYDNDADMSWIDDEDRANYGRGAIEILRCAIETLCPECGHWKYGPSLGGIAIHIDDRSYRRVVEAELAMEL